MELFHLTLEGSFLLGRSSRGKRSPESKSPISRGACMLGYSCPGCPDPGPAPKATEERLVFMAAEVQQWVESLTLLSNGRQKTRDAPSKTSQQFMGTLSKGSSAVRITHPAPKSRILVYSYPRCRKVKRRITGHPTKERNHFISPAHLLVCHFPG